MDNEIYIRLGVFCGLFLIVMLWEVLAPRRVLRISRGWRWTSNLAIVVINSLVLRWLFPVLAVGFAMESQNRGWGLLNKIDLGYGANLAVSVVFLDFIIYLQHAMVHFIPLFWRIHRMHHTDLDFDVTTGSRFHPIEIVLSMVIKIAVIAALGPLPLAVFIFEIVLNGTALFNHGNIRLPLRAERVIRWLIVTPDMHRIHHSIYPEETNSNFGFSLSLWDRLCGTYRAQPKDSHEKMVIGIERFRHPKYLHLHWLLIQPFLNEKKS